MSASPTLLSKFARLELSSICVIAFYSSVQWTQCSMLCYICPISIMFYMLTQYRLFVTSTTSLPLWFQGDQMLVIFFNLTDMTRIMLTLQPRALQNNLGPFRKHLTTLDPSKIPYTTLEHSNNNVTFRKYPTTLGPSNNTPTTLDPSENTLKPRALQKYLTTLDIQINPQTFRKHPIQPWALQKHMSLQE